MDLTEITWQAVSIVFAAALGTGGVGALLGARSTRRKTHAEAEAIDEARFKQRVQTLGLIIDELTGSVDRYQSSLTRLEKRYDALLEKGAANQVELEKARSDLLEHKETIKALRLRITQLENVLTDSGIAIPDAH